MKIVFDSEEELEELTKKICPKDIGLNEFCSMEWTCLHCWKQTGIVEIKEKED